MTKEELNEFFLSEGYKYERDSEYNRDVYTNNKIVVDGQDTKIEVFVDYYTIKIVWLYDSNRKIVTSLPIKKTELGLLQLTMKELISNKT